MKIIAPKDSNGLFILSKDDFDVIAEEVLYEKQPNSLKTPCAVDIDSLINNGLNLETTSEFLSKNCSILGLISFDNQKIPVYDNDYNKTFIMAHEGTIITEKKLKNTPTRLRFTKAHEASHWMLHRGVFKPINRNYSFRNQDYSFVACRSEKKYRKNPIQATTWYHLCEWQSDCLAAAILMPKITLIQAVEQIIPLSELKKADSKIVEIVSEKIALLFNVSKRSVKIRFSTLNLI